MLSRLLIAIIIVTSVSTAQNKTDDNKLTGILYLDSKTSLENYVYFESPSFAPAVSNEKSPVLAGLLSLLVPGAGEFYAGEYWKAAAFIVLEAGLITTGLVYDKKGDNKTTEFENYADENWSVVKYAEWLIEYRLSGEDPGIISSNDPALPPWQRINWRILNENEHGSHKLPPHGDQQYYELIGKYHQYSVGWNDFDTELHGSNFNLATQNMLYYSGERGTANSYYNTASAAVVGIYINHFLSAFDGVWSAVQYNNNLAVKLRVEGQQFAYHYEYIPTVHVRLAF